LVTYLFGLSDVFWERKDIQCESQTPPGVDVVNLSPVEAVKLVDQGFLEALMRVCSFLIFAAPSEVVTHAIELLGRRAIGVIIERGILSKEIVEMPCTILILPSLFLLLRLSAFLSTFSIARCTLRSISGILHKGDRRLAIVRT